MSGFQSMQGIGPFRALDDDGNLVRIGATGVNNNELMVQETFSHVLLEVLTEIKIINLHLKQITGAGFEDHNTEQ